MGPRPLGRGWKREGEWFDEIRLASMGPRPLGRGWHVPILNPSPAVHGFNGAATARSRMASLLLS